ncbi:uncharacterized protein LTR77_004618 [Saxophila tyrrhenica]|uniref:Ima1 N-terminal domain-containing protein n=1 Tax=Saxophila tyrrhenica TaxID=1690608 RepID=A0AAV9PH73_9PEZI|nr:hypothetical protein LTR77_004618 [Saxophila tyrrhenica]
MFWRLRCYSCGTRSPHSKGTHEFQCANCEAYNFYDTDGNVVDTPDTIAAPPVQPSKHRYQTFTRPLPRDAPRNDDEIFCNRCRNNQRIYTEALSNALPDEDHPEYAEYEARLPQLKADLEQKWPLICTRCASKAQQKIRQADYYGKTQQASRMMLQTRKKRGGSPVGQRDDWGKWSMRMLLKAAGMVVYASLLAQMAWHAYGILAALTGSMTTEDAETVEFAFDPSVKDCAKQTRLLHFDPSCYQLFATLIPKALLTGLCLLWYNPGISSWYHHTWRMEAVNGQTEHFRIQAVLLIIRLVAWIGLTDVTTTGGLSKQKLMAAHGFMIAFIALCQWVSERTISPQRWVLRGKIMPKPDEADFFGGAAGPAEEQYDRQASSVPPQLRLFPRNETPFPIERLAPQQPRRGYSRLELPANPPPSPPITDDDMMDIDTNYEPPTLRSAHNQSTNQSLGWGGMRNELFDIHDSTRAQQDRQRQRDEQPTKLRYQPPNEQNPFRGRLPPAPMSMERRLRNPPTQVSFKKAPLSKQQDFMKQMREGIESGKGFTKPNAAQAAQGVHAAFALDEDSDFSPIKTRRVAHSTSMGEVLEDEPAKSRTKGSLDLRPGNWTLKGDLDTATGLEDLFGGTSFRIADENGVQNGRAAMSEQAHSSVATRGWVLLAVIAAVAAVVVVEPVRRTVCFWLIARLEAMGY